jgi:hypothetical protein
VGADAFAAAAAQFIVIAIITGGDAISHLMQVGTTVVPKRSRTQHSQMPCVREWLPFSLASSLAVFCCNLQHKSPEDSTVVLAFAVVSILVLSAFGIYKLCINQYVESKALEQGEDCPHRGDWLRCTACVLPAHFGMCWRTMHDTAWVLLCDTCGSLLMQTLSHRSPWWFFPLGYWCQQVSTTGCFCSMHILERYVCFST